MPHSFFLIWHLCHITWKLQVIIWTFFISNDCSTGATCIGPWTCITVILWYNTVIQYVYCKPIHTFALLFGAQLHMTTNSRSLWPYYTPNNGFTAHDALFYKNKIGQLLIHIAVSFRLQWTLNTCTLVLKLIRSSTVLLDKLRESAHVGAVQRV